MNYIDLFSGIGGFVLGAKWAGIEWKKHYFSEIDEYAIKVYQKHFPEAENLGDITKIDTNKLPAGDYIITGGFPCQDISIAGKGEGLTGERSGLWFEMWRIIRDIRPRFAIIENVGMLARHGLSTVLGNLAEIGYNAEWQDIRASDMGAPHRRERIWIVAYSMSTGEWGAEWKEKIKKNVMADADEYRLQNRLWENRGRKETPRAYQGRSIKGCCDKISNPDSNKQHWRSCTLQMGKSQGTEEIKEDFTFPGNQWSVESGLGGMVDGISVKMDRY